MTHPIWSQVSISSSARRGTKNHLSMYFSSSTIGTSPCPDHSEARYGSELRVLHRRKAGRPYRHIARGFELNDRPTTAAGALGGIGSRGGSTLEIARFEEHGALLFTSNHELAAGRTSPECQTRTLLADRAQSRHRPYWLAHLHDVSPSLSNVDALERLAHSTTDRSSRLVSGIIIFN